MRDASFTIEDHATWLPLVKSVIRVKFPGGFSPPVERCEVEQECLIQIPKIIADYHRKKTAPPLEKFVRRAVLNDAKDYLRAVKRELSLQSITAGFRSGGPVPGEFLDEHGHRSRTMPDASDVTFWIASSPSESIAEEHLEHVKRVLTTEQYRVYMCRFLLGMTQEETASYLGAENRVIRAIEYAHNSAVSNSVRATADRAKRTPQRSR